jgi:oxygen-independent coproporphyrinogen-3 oxidase
LGKLLEMVGARFRLAGGYEFSVEANPSGLTPEKVAVLAEHGVNRVSLGVQSFSEELLAVLERDHREAEILAAIDNLRSRIDNIGLDLIFAVPGQSLQEWRRTLSRAVDLQPAHVSTYGLTFEKGTAFWSRREHGSLRSADEELERAMYETAIEVLPSCGLEQYELSNFARPGHACRHNETYWLGLPYFGFGPGAASYRGGVRRTNHRSVTTWIRRVLSGKSGTQMEEQLSPEDRAREAIWLGLRRIQGINRSTFRDRFGMDLDELAGDRIRDLADRGLIMDDGHGVRLTREGRMLADSVAEAFL